MHYIACAAAPCPFWQEQRVEIIVITCAHKCMQPLRGPCCVSNKVLGMDSAWCAINVKERRDERSIWLLHSSIDTFTPPTFKGREPTIFSSLSSPPLHTW